MSQQPGRKIPVMDLVTQDKPAMDSILKAIDTAVKTTAFVHAPIIGEFEKAFAAWVGAKTTVGVNSGTAALHLGLKAMGIAPGDEVITTPFTFIATAEAVVHVGAKLVFADIDADDFCIDPKSVERAITPKTKAIVPVHLYGHPADMTEIMRIARTGKIQVLEDSAQAHGTTWNGRKVGTLGDASAFSFYPGKNLGAYGDGGGVTTDNDAIAAKIKSLRDHGREAKYSHSSIGFCERLDGIQASILLAKLAFLDGWIAERRRLAARYDRLLPAVGVRAPVVKSGATHAYHLYVVRMKNRDAVQKAMQTKGISTAVAYPIPLHLQPCFQDFGFKPGQFPNAELAANEVLALPLYPGLSESDQDYVVEALGQVVRG